MKIFNLHFSTFIARRTLLFLMLICSLSSYGDKKEGFKKGVHDFSFSDGRIYSGEWLDYQPSGKGTMKWPDGTSYTGSFAFGKPSGEGIMNYHDGNTYQGYFIDGLPSGEGKKILVDGTELSGNWVNGNLNGKAHIQYADGAIYDGIVSDGSPHGYGTLTSGDRIWVGNFKNGELSSQYKLTVKGDLTIEYDVDGENATINYDNTLIYNGRIEDLQPKGKGTLNYTDGITVVGDWEALEYAENATVTYPSGNKFTGKWDFADGAVGQGVMTQPHGGKAEGIFKEGELFNGTMTNFRITDVDEYTGPVVDGQCNGLCKIYSYSGDFKGNQYEGSVINGKKHGKGLFVLSDGGKAEGIWENDKLLNGTVVDYIFDDGKYTGKIINGVKEGNGTLIFPDGANKYVGNFKNDIPNGQGTLTIADGSRYSGQWKDGKLFGQGTIVSSSGEKYVGHLSDFFPNGQGTLTFADGRRYSGQWKDGKRCGQGTFVWPNGDKYVGHWSGDDMNGQGTRTYGPGQPWIKETGVFRNGRLVNGTLVRTNGTFVGTWDEYGNAISVKKIEEKPQKTVNTVSVRRAK